MATAKRLEGAPRSRIHDDSIELYVHSCWTAKLLLKAKVDEVKIDSKGKFISIDIDDDETAKPEFNILASESPVKCSKLVGQLRERAQELDDSLHGIVRKEGKIVSRMGGIPADFGWQVRTANEVKLLRDSAAALEKSGVAEMVMKVEALQRLEADISGSADIFMQESREGRYIERKAVLKILKANSEKESKGDGR